MDIRSFFGSGGSKTTKKSKPPAALRQQQQQRRPSSASADGAASAASASRDKKAKAKSKSKSKASDKKGKKAASNGSSSSSGSKKEAAAKSKGKGKAKANRLVIDDDDDSATEDETPVPTPSAASSRSNKTASNNNKVNDLSDDDDNDDTDADGKAAPSDDGSVTDDGGLGNIVRVVSTPDRRRAGAGGDNDDASDSGDTDDKKTKLKSPSNRKDWEKALSPGGGSAATKKRKSPSAGSSPKPRKLEVSASEYFASVDKKKSPKSKSTPAKKKGGGRNDDDDDLMGDTDEEEQEAASLAKDKQATKPTANKKQRRVKEEGGSNSSDEDMAAKEGAGAGKSKAKAGANKAKKRALQIDSDDDEEEDFADAAGGNDNDDDDDFQPVKEEDSDSDDDEDFSPTSSRKAKATKKKASPKKKKKIKVEEPDDNDEEEEEEPAAKKAASPKKAAKKATPKKSPKKKAAAAKMGPPPKPTVPVDSYPSDKVATSQLLTGYAFVFTGLLGNLHRDEAEDYVKILGGRVTKQVSGKTSYLVCGDMLEDGRAVTEGSKHRKALEQGPDKCVILHGEKEFYGLVKMLDDEAKAKAPKIEEPAVKNEEEAASPVAAAAAAVAADAPVKTESASKPANPYAARNPSGGAAPANPYAKPANPYAKAANPYAKPAGGASASNPYAKMASSPSAPMAPSPPGDSNALWADKYAPKNSSEILGNGKSVQDLQRWLRNWEDTNNNPKRKGGKRAALLSGPPGIGKTTTATLIARETGRDVLELNASDARGKKALKENLGDVCGSQVLNFGPKKGGKGGGVKKKRCIIMDEVDGMGAGDRSGMAELIAMIKKSKVPIICICNDRQSQKVRSLANHCLDLKYKRPIKTMIARRAIEVARMEGMYVEQNAAEAIAESCGNDIRQVLNSLQMWSSKKQDDNSNRSADMTYKDVKDRQNSINKDEILRVSMFDACRQIIEGPKGIADADEKTKRDSLFKRSDAFFTDYGLMGLQVQHNYLKVMIPQFQQTKAKGNPADELAILERMVDATNAMSEFAIGENGVRGADQNWALLPMTAMLCVKAGHHAAGPTGGFLPGYPEFAGWLGKNSSRGKKTRLLHELGHHMNYHVSADTTELRLGYIPALRQEFLKLMLDKNGAKVEEVINMMDEYGLDRDDIFEKLDEFNLDKKADKFSDIDSKTKAAFTREYNKGSHKSQALVEEQGVSKKKKSSGGNGSSEIKDPDAIDEDGVGGEEDDEDDELNEAEVAKAFKKMKGKKGKAKKPAGKKKK